MHISLQNKLVQFILAPLLTIKSLDMKAMMKYLSVFVLTFCSLSCQQKQAPQSQGNDLAPLVRQYFDYFNQHDWEKMAGMYADSASFLDPSFGVEKVKQSHAEIVTKYQQLQEAIPDVKDEIVQLYPSGPDCIIVEFLASGTGPDGQLFKMPICAILKFKAGKIVEDLTYYDE
jgi:ketosteroid isomerase-like protein